MPSLLLSAVLLVLSFSETVFKWAACEPQSKLVVRGCLQDRPIRVCPRRSLVQGRPLKSQWWPRKQPLGSLAAPVMNDPSGIPFPTSQAAVSVGPPA